MKRPWSRFKFFRSIRFRLSALYSAVVFGLGGLILAALYIAVRWQLTRQTETRLVIRGQQVQLGQFNLIVDPRLEEAQVRTLESMFNQFVLDQLARYTLHGHRPALPHQPRRRLGDRRPGAGTG